MSPAARAFLALGTVAALAAGCGKSTGTTDGGGGGGTLADYQALVQTCYVSGMEVPPGLDATAGVVVTADVDGVRAAAAIWRQGAVFVDVGAVTVHDTPRVLPVEPDTLVRRSVPVAGTPYYAYSTVPSLPAMPHLVFDGTRDHVVTASGAPGVPAMRDSVRSVARPVVSGPAQDAVVPRAADLAVAWSDAGTDTSVLVLCTVRSLVDSTRWGYALPVHDTAGQATVPANLLQPLPPGAARLAVVRYRRLLRVPGALAVNLVCEAVTLRSLTLQ